MKNSPKSIIKSALFPVLATIICLQIAFYSALSAVTYDFTARDKNDSNLRGVEYDLSGGKTLNVCNRSERQAYVYIGYEGIGCERTIFILNPGQTGRVYKSPFCVPINISGYFRTQDNSIIGDIPNPIRKTRMDDVGTLQWNIYGKDGIEYLGSWDEYNQRWDKKILYHPSLIG